MVENGWKKKVVERRHMVNDDILLQKMQEFAQVLVSGIE
jgi:hypothetical protein